MKQMSRFLLSLSFAVAIVFCIPVGTVPMAAQTVFRPDIPKTWDENACRRLQASRHDLRSSSHCIGQRQESPRRSQGGAAAPRDTDGRALGADQPGGCTVGAELRGLSHILFAHGRSVSGSPVRRWTDVPCEPSEDRNRPDRLRADHF